jgi:two-component system cell cycle sensor histidine kinase/response regulator CckA
MNARSVILLIEDDPAHAELARRAFEHTKGLMDLYLAETLAEARAFLKQGRHPAPNVVLSDLNLPDGTALELLTGDVPLVIMTSQGDEQRAVSAMKGGALDYVVKSSEMYRDLPLTIERALRAARLERERLVAEASLRESEQRFRQLADNMQEAFWLYDLAEARMVYASPAWPRVYGGSGLDLSAAAEARLTAVHAEDRERVRRCFAEDAPHRALDQAFRLVIDGRVHWIEERTFPVLDPAGRPYRVAGLGMDVTRRRELEQNLRQSQKMEAVGQLAGGVAHDFNNMLTAILSAAEQLEEICSDPEQQELCAMVSGAAERAAELTRRLLSFSRKGRVHAKPIDVHEVIADAVRLLQHSIDRRVRLVTKLGAPAAVVVGDAGQLQNALLNLGINARDAMPEGGELCFSTEVRYLDEDARAAMPFDLRQEKYLHVSVTDTGVGIPADSLARIFDPFFTTKAVGQGTGLGLSAVYGTVVEHAGAITVYSEVGHGTVFHLYLPLSDGVAIPREPETEATPGSGLVLMVEDEVLVREVGQRLLQSLGYEVVVAKDGAEGLRIFTERHAELVAVMCDIVMPVLSGADATARMREIDAQVPIILCSGYPRGDRTSSLPLVADAVLSKPFHRRELAAVLARVARPSQGR